MKPFTPLAKVADGWLIGFEDGTIGWGTLEFVEDVRDNHLQWLSDFRFIHIEDRAEWIVLDTQNNKVRIEIKKWVGMGYTIRCGFSAKQKIWIAATPKRILQINYA